MNQLKVTVRAEGVDSLKNDTVQNRVRKGTFLNTTLIVMASFLLGPVFDSDGHTQDYRMSSHCAAETWTFNDTLN